MTALSTLTPVRIVAPAGGGPGGAVDSVDGRTGTVTLSDKYVDVGGDTMSGPLDLTGNELRNVVTHKLAAAPATPVEGLRYYDTVTKTERYWNGTAWVSLAEAAAGGVTSVDGQTGVVDLSAKYVDVAGDTMTGQLVVGVPAANTPAIKLAIAGVTAAEIRASTFGIGIGTDALKVASGAATNNAAVGTSALTALTTGGNNTALGHSAGSGLTTGSQNTLVGYQAGANASYQLTTANANTFIGYQAGQSAGTQNANNVAIGYLARVAGANSVAVGSSAWAASVSSVAVGENATAAGTQSVAIGSAASVASTMSNGIAIGKSSSVTGSGGVALGFSVTAGANEFKLGGTSHLYVLPGPSISFPTAAGTKIGAATTEKLAFWNTAPVVQPAGWSTTAGYTPVKTFNAESCTLTELARFVATLADTLKLVGLLGA